MVNLRKYTREEREMLANEHLKMVEERLSSEIKNSIENTTFYDSSILNQTIDTKNRNFDTKIEVTPNDTVTQLFEVKENSDKIAVLNFASFKHPGGMFLAGSPAQEEFLCHHSTLYPVLKSFTETYYARHMNCLNKGLYSDELLYSKDIKFVNRTILPSCTTTWTDSTFADVITCAAPNAGVYRRYFDTQPKTNYPEYKIKGGIILDTLYKRFDLILSAALDKGAEILILGAFGCGVFKNSPLDVAATFFQLLSTVYKDLFKEVYFAIPKGNNCNYDVFCDALKSSKRGFLYWYGIEDADF